jgi:hypothetical protein
MATPDETTPNKQVNDETTSVVSPPVDDRIPLFNGKDAKGRFVRGNRGGPGGDPAASKAARLRLAIIRSITAEDLHAVVAKLIEQAKGGDVQSVREIAKLAGLYAPEQHEVSSVNRTVFEALGISDDGNQPN